MTNSKKSPLLKKAIEFITSNIRLGNWKEGQRLYNQPQLAQMAGVGQKCMAKALSLLKKEKVICYKQKSGIFIGDTIPRKTPVKKMLRWEKIKLSIAQDILKGEFRDSDYLPLSKVLAGDYHVDYETMQKALRMLVEEKIITREKQRYRILNQVSATPAKTICFIMSVNAFEGNYSNSTPLYFNEFFRSLEKTCITKNIRVVPCIEQSGIAFPESMDFNSIVGFIIWNCEQLNTAIKEIILRIISYKKPIAILNLLYQTGSGICSQLEKLCKTHGTLFISDANANIRAGFEMGRFLIEKGHKKICLFSHKRDTDSLSEQLDPFNQKCWDLFDGMSSAFAAANIPEGIVPMYWDDHSQSEWDLYKTDKDRDHEASIKNEMDQLDNGFVFFEKTLPATDNKQMAIHLFELKISRNLRSFNAPMFRKALAYNDVTAWVCLADDIAIYGIMEFLKSEQIQVPKQIGVLGFDDIAEAKMHRLSTWHTDYSGAARKMVSMILFPEHAKKVLCVKGTNFFEVDGMVIDRGSV